MKIIVVLITMFILLSCNVERHYERGSFIKNKKLNHLPEKFNLNENESVIFFTETYNNDSLLFKNNKDEIIKKVLLNSRPQLELTSMQLLPNNEDIILDLKNSRKIIIKKKELSKYKFVYIAKPAFKNDKYIITFTNDWKRLR